MRVPLLDLRAQYATIRDEVDEAIRRVVRSQQFILGPVVEELESQLGAYLGVRHAIGMSSGTDALLAALWVLGVGPGDRVMVPAYSFFATAGTVSRLGARPLLVDIDPRSYNMDPDALAETVARLDAREHPRIKAIVPVHLFGQCATMPAILAVAATLGATVVEDAAQAIGALDADGRGAGTIGRVACFSFYPSKNLGAYGDAGLVTTGDSGLAEQLRLVRNHGAEARYHHRLVGGNFRLDALQAAVLLAKLPHLDAWGLARQERAARYDRLFAESGLIAEGHLRLPERVHCGSASGRDHIFHQYVVRAVRRDPLRVALSADGVGTEVYYPVPFHLQECFRSLGYGPGAFPVAETAARESLALPMYPELTPTQQEYVVGRIARFYRTT